MSSDRDNAPSPTAEPSTRGLFGGTLARSSAVGAVSDEAWLAAMLEAEVALARAEARVGLISADDARAIERAAAETTFDIDAIGAQAAETGTPVVAIVERLRDAVGDPRAEAVHRGATSQDIVDTAMMLVARRALTAIVRSVERAADAAFRLASDHRAARMAARTLLQQAVPTTFGLKAAGWMIGLDEAALGLRALIEGRLAVQLGGAAGTLSAFGRDPQALMSAYAAELGLAEPVLPWHTQRNRIAEIASALGVASGAVGKAARDVALLAQTEVGEVREGVAGRGGSSAMPHKQNPVAAVSALACVLQAPGLVATLLASMIQEHERGAGTWQAEWIPFRGLLVAVGSGAAWLTDCLEHLEIDEQTMAANLARLDAMLGPDGTAGGSDALVDRALAAHRAHATKRGRP